jgi:hypothetical protein
MEISSDFDNSADTYKGKPILRGSKRRGMEIMSKFEWTSLIGVLATHIERGKEINEKLFQKYGSDILKIAEEKIKVEKNSLGYFIIRIFPNHVEVWELSELEIPKSLEN